MLEERDGVIFMSFENKVESAIRFSLGHSYHKVQFQEFNSKYCLGPV